MLDIFTMCNFQLQCKYILPRMVPLAMQSQKFMRNEEDLYPEAKKYQETENVDLVYDGY